MSMLEKGINISNQGKRDNVKERMEVDFLRQKKFKNLRNFLRKQRGIAHYKQAP